MKKHLLLVLFSAAMMCSCTISVVDSHTEKGSQETLSEDQATSPNVDPKINAPIKSPNSGVVPAIPKSSTTPVAPSA